ncbi:MAG TPA: hypothetical protein VGM11_12685 [Acidobacteriaceae bacterium]
MTPRSQRYALCTLSLFFTLLCPAQPLGHSAHASTHKHHSAQKAAKKDNHKPIVLADIHNPVLWTDPGDIARKNLFYGSGGEDGQPAPPFRFLDVDKHDSNPKFDAEDANGHTWRVKLGAEARPEIVCSRLLWAVGYFTENDYVLPEATVPGLHLRHTAHSVRDHDVVLNARFAIKPGGEKRLASWRWKQNPFRDTRELNGLRVMMALLNNWDLKDENNAVYSDKATGQQIFLVSDTGASFGTTSVRIRNSSGKGNVKQYAHSRFITHETATTVSFATPAPATRLLVESGGLLAPIYFRRQHYLWIPRNIPREDARWIGTLLSHLTHQQLIDAFRAGRFTDRETELYITVLEQRIAELQDL